MKKLLLLFSALILNTIFAQNLLAQEFDFFEPKVTIGGYGELHYNYSKPENKIGKQILDFHRFVVFLGYAWTEKWSFKSEVELEHNIVDGEKGELELEQAYVNYHHANYLGLQAGVLLVSAGLINEYHEPPGFFGVERPDYHKLIIPTTWFGNGVSLYGIAGEFDYKLVVLEGLNSDNFKVGSGIRSGRQSGFKADAKNLLYNGRVDFTGIDGLRIGFSYSYNNANGDSTQNKIGLAELHAQYRQNNIYATLEAGNISYSTGDVNSSRGFYFDLGYNIGRVLKLKSKLIPFVRYSDINTAADTRNGGVREQKYHYTKWMIGLSYLPIDRLVFKIDYSKQTTELESFTTDFLNLGVGYWF